MTDYQKEYRQALRRGDAEEANRIYREHLRKDSATSSEDEKVEENSKKEDGGEDLEAPDDMNVDESKEYAEELEGEALEDFYDMEVEGKDRSTLVDYLEKELE